MKLMRGIAAAAAVALFASPALAGDVDAELDEIHATIEERHAEWEPDRLADVIVLYNQARDAQEEGDEAAAEEAVGELNTLIDG